MADHVREAPDGAQSKVDRESKEECHGREEDYSNQYFTRDEGSMTHYEALL